MNMTEVEWDYYQQQFQRKHKELLRQRELLFSDNYTLIQQLEEQSDIVDKLLEMQHQDLKKRVEDLKLLLAHFHDIDVRVKGEDISECVKLTDEQPTNSKPLLQIKIPENDIDEQNVKNIKEAQTAPEQSRTPSPTKRSVFRFFSRPTSPTKVAVNETADASPAQNDGIPKIKKSLLSRITRQSKKKGQLPEIDFK
ncbi:hypothetical protein MIR68_003388 [Amoeboaphelidium protococcarum]|nr:hypothetical protein MIR68_003388 [Amoeboaphelidium protococcarum]